MDGASAAKASSSTGGRSSTRSTTQPRFVFTGALKEIETSPLGHLLHAPAETGPGPEALAAAEAAIRSRSATALYDDLESTD